MAIGASLNYIKRGWVGSKGPQFVAALHTQRQAVTFKIEREGCSRMARRRRLRRTECTSRLKLAR